MSFQGFLPAAVDFLWQLRFNNERSWFEPRKQEYIDLIREPMRQLATQVQQTVCDRHPKLQLNLKISRIYRDARRLHGRGPYKDHLWFVLHRPEDDANNGPAFYFELAPEYYSIGMGYWAATPVTMAKFRARIDRDPTAVEKLARRLARQDNFKLEGELYRRPKGDKGKRLDPWYNRRNLALTWDRPCEGSLFAPELAGEIADGVEFLLPYFEYLASLAADPEPAKA